MNRCCRKPSPYILLHRSFACHKIQLHAKASCRSQKPSALAVAQDEQQHIHQAAAASGASVLSKHINLWPILSVGKVRGHATHNTDPRRYTNATHAMFVSRRRCTHLPSGRYNATHIAVGLRIPRGTTRHSSAEHGQADLVNKRSQHTHAISDGCVQ